MLGPTPWQTVGPYFSLGLGAPPRGEVVGPGSPASLRLFGVVRDGAGEPVPDALLELCQPDGCARAATGAGGEFEFLTVKPAPSLGLDGAAQAPHLLLSVFGRGLLRRLVTRVYFPDEADANAVDPLLGRLADPAALVARAEDGGLRFDVNLQGEAETVFLDV